MEDPYPPATVYDSRLVMIDDPLFSEVLNYARDGGERDFRVLREHFSSPRLFDVYLRDFNPESGPSVGITLVCDHTLLADNSEPTIAISIDRWNKLFKRSACVVDRPQHREKFVRAQIWSVDPTQCGFNRIAIGTLLSFTDQELQDPRLGLAVGEFAKMFGFTNKD
jgi:hypothetical protein